MWVMGLMRVSLPSACVCVYEGVGGLWVNPAPGLPTCGLDGQLDDWHDTQQLSVTNCLTACGLSTVSRYQSVEQFARQTAAVMQLDS